MDAVVSAGKTELTQRVGAIPPRALARIAGVCYAVTVVTSLFDYFLAGGSRLGHDAGLVAGAAYLVVTLALYELLKPVDGRLSLLAVFFSLEGISHRGNDALFFFGFYCIAVGYLMRGSPYFPRLLGALVVLAGVGLLVHDAVELLPSALGRVVSPLGLALDGLGEILLALWLLVVGVRPAPWEKRANRTRTVG